MPIKIPNELPAAKVLTDEKHFYHDRNACDHTGYSCI